MYWKQVIDYEGLYEVNSEGQIRNFKTKKILKGYINKDGYISVTLRKNGKGKTHLLHRIILQSFNPIDNSKLTVNHINHNKQDNRLANLEWLENISNVKEAWDSGVNDFQCTKVMCVETGDIFSSIRKAAFYFNGSMSGLQKALNQPEKTFKGFHWIEAKQN